ncbi:MAG: cell division protein SepF [Bowdeniella nasicola]|nr:cell division protein SepF [Bowdeniella nasicola]
MAGVLRKTMDLFLLSEPEEQQDVYEDFEEFEPEVETERTADVTPISSAASAQGRFDVVEGPELSRIVTFHPTAYNEAKTIGTAFRESIPVILNLTAMSDADGKRMLDFCAGLTYGLDGTIERVTNRVFLLSPATVEVLRDSETSDLADRI